MSQQPDAVAVRRQLDRILASRQFVRSLRMCRFLRCIVEESLSNPQPELKESFLASAVFDRKDDFDPAADPVVRVEARRLRSKLENYYQSEGAGDSLRIRLPVGTYTPVFEFAAPTGDSRPAESQSKPRLTGRIVFVAAACAILITLTGAILWLVKPASFSRPRSVAVLPFLDLSPDRNLGYFCDGLAEQIMSILAHTDGLYVPGRMSSFVFRSPGANSRDVGAALHVDRYLEGSVRRSGDRVRITAALISATDGARLWSHTYERQFNETFALQDEIASSVSNALGLRLPRRKGSNSGTSPAGNADALDQYHRGREAWYRNDFPSAVNFFRSAIAQDAGYAPAYSGLARSFARMETEPGALLNAEQYARRAIEIDETLAEAVMVLAVVRIRQWDWKGAEAEFRHALQLDPQLAEAHGEYAIGYLAPSGRIAEALRESTASIRLEPSAPFENIRHGVLLTYARQYPQAEQQLRKAMSQAPQFTARHLGKLYLAEGQYDRALPLFESEPLWKAVALARAGRREEARRFVRDTADVYTALFWDAMGDRDRAFEIMEQAYHARAMALTTLANPVWDPLRSDQRFQALLSRMGLHF
jgi:TolB-like protein